MDSSSWMKPCLFPTPRGALCLWPCPWTAAWVTSDPTIPNRRASCRTRRPAWTSYSCWAGSNSCAACTTQTWGCHTRLRWSCARAWCRPPPQTPTLNCHVTRGTLCTPPLPWKVSWVPRKAYGHTETWSIRRRARVPGVFWRQTPCVSRNLPIQVYSRHTRICCSRSKCRKATVAGCSDRILRLN